VARSSELTEQRINQLVQDSYPCVCRRDPWFTQNGFVGACGHVVTCDPAALKNACAEFKLLFAAGAKHRPDSRSATMTDLIRTAVLTDISTTLQYFATRQRNRVVWAAYVQQVVNHVHQQLLQPAFANGTVFCGQRKPHAPGTVFLSYSPEFDTYLRHLHQSFVITTADKLSNNYVLVCKNTTSHKCGGICAATETLSSIAESHRRLDFPA